MSETPLDYDVPKGTRIHHHDAIGGTVFSVIVTAALVIWAMSQGWPIVKMVTGSGALLLIGSILCFTIFFKRHLMIGVFICVIGVIEFVWGGLSVVHSG